MTSSSPQRSQEVRIGLVMYGGVSLAVYINGVAQEFYHAVQGNGVYRLIKELTDSEIVVDILSGSSAGGINGILLSYALSNQKDFTRCAGLWRQSADIRRLVRSPKSGDGAVRSVLDSEGYYQAELEHAFRALDGSMAVGEAPSEVRELDLFITGTNIDGNTYSRVDDAGHLIAVKDHRAVFQLKHRQGRKSNFDATKNPAVITALSKLARLTSCFPGAFAPVYVPCTNPLKREPSRMSSNELLQYWGKLQRSAYYIDGGVIDNKPFTHTIREIFFRTTERKVDRRLYYVEPDPERLDRAGTSDLPDGGAPSFLKPIFSSLVSIPGYESIADDLRLLARRNEDILQYKRVVADVGAVYTAPCAADYGVDVPAEIPEPLKSVYSRARIASLSEPLLAGVFRKATRENSPRLSRRRALLIEEFDERARSNPQTLRDFDVHFRLRRVFHLIYHLYELLYRDSGETVPAERRERYQQLFKALNRQLELLNVLSSAMERLADEADYGWSESGEDSIAEVWSRVQAGFHRLLHAEGLEAHLDDLSDLNRQLQVRIEGSRTPTFDVANFRSILPVADERERRFLSEILAPGDAVLHRYRNFNLLDAHVYPVEWVSGLREKDIVEVCRISPADAQRGFSNRPAAEKVSGDSLAHFSAFFKRSWRANDILWGRMDGVCELIETLLTREKLSAGMARPEARARARAALLPESGPSPIDAWFRESSEEAVRRIKEWVAGITSDDEAERRQAAVTFYPDDPEDKEQSLRDLLIEMSQFRILHETLPMVFEDSIKDQMEWKRVRQPSSGNEAQRLEWMGTDVAVDGATLEAISRIGGRRILDSLETERTEELWPSRSKLGQTFGTFRSGAEEILGGAVPPVILAEIASKALLVLRSCILGSLRKPTAARIQASSYYRWAIDLPLRALYGIVLFLKAAPNAKTTILMVLTIVSILALFVGIHWRDAIIQPGGNFDLLWFSVFIIAPVAILTAELYQFGRLGLERTSLSDRVRGALTLVLLFAPLFSVTLLYLGITDTVRDWLAGNETLEPAPDYMQYVMILVYGIIPFVLSFLGGYLAVREQAQRRLSPENLRDALERLTESELQDVSDRMGHRFAVRPDTRLDVALALAARAEEDHKLGALERAIRAAGGLL
jgi:predicted acylesterase/phospholipase RssA